MVRENRSLRNPKGFEERLFVGQECEHRRCEAGVREDRRSFWGLWRCVRQNSGCMSTDGAIGCPLPPAKVFRGNLSITSFTISSECTKLMDNKDRSNERGLEGERPRSRHETP